MLTTLTAPKIRPPRESVPARINRDNQRRAADRHRDVAFHTPCDLGDEGRPAGVSDGDAGGCLLCRPHNFVHRPLHRFQPAHAFAVSRQFPARFDKEQAKGAIDRSEHRLVLAETGRGT
ncbi:MAG: hypothetical protein DME19_04430 [Verrucomicrobia bacterium]|nr:MAG: hypothetical protein DME19_04430 [Verrucomicrobiota bacterium]